MAYRADVIGHLGSSTQRPSVAFLTFQIIPDRFLLLFFLHARLRLHVCIHICLINWMNHFFSKNASHHSSIMHKKNRMYVWYTSLHRHVHRHTGFPPEATSRHVRRTGRDRTCDSTIPERRGTPWGWKWPQGKNEIEDGYMEINRDTGDQPTQIF